MSRYLQVFGQSKGCFSEPIVLWIDFSTLPYVVAQGNHLLKKYLFQTFTAALVLLQSQVTISSNEHFTVSGQTP